MGTQVVPNVERICSTTLSYSHLAQEYRNLAEAVINNTNFTIPTPMTQDRLEEILLEYGLMDALQDDYKI